ncbi:hypothetical protein CDIK_1878 [Cucumispora dikerogammari]|nr:hypothetical protein CDIK_1878 [Cucumispora dikerogammari]
MADFKTKLTEEKTDPLLRIHTIYEYQRADTNPICVPSLLEQLVIANKYKKSFYEFFSLSNEFNCFYIDISSTCHVSRQDIEKIMTLFDEKYVCGSSRYMVLTAHGYKKTNGIDVYTYSYHIIIRLFDLNKGIEYNIHNINIMKILAIEMKKIITGIDTAIYNPKGQLFKCLYGAIEDEENLRYEINLEISNLLGINPSLYVNFSLGTVPLRTYKTVKYVGALDPINTEITLNKHTVCEDVQLKDKESIKVERSVVWKGSISNFIKTLLIQDTQEETRDGLSVISYKGTCMIQNTNHTEDRQWMIDSGEYITFGCYNDSCKEKGLVKVTFPLVSANIKEMTPIVCPEEKVCALEKKQVETELCNVNNLVPYSNNDNRQKAPKLSNEVCFTTKSFFDSSENDISKENIYFSQATEDTTIACESQLDSKRRLSPADLNAIINTMPLSETIKHEIRKFFEKRNFPSFLRLFGSEEFPIRVWGNPKKTFFKITEKKQNVVIIEKEDLIQTIRDLEIKKKLFFSELIPLSTDKQAFKANFDLCTSRFTYSDKVLKHIGRFFSIDCDLLNNPSFLNTSIGVLNLSTGEMIRSEQFTKGFFNYELKMSLDADTSSVKETFIKLFNNCEETYYAFFYYLSHGIILKNKLSYIIVLKGNGMKAPSIFVEALSIAFKDKLVVNNLVKNHTGSDTIEKPFPDVVDNKLFIRIKDTTKAIDKTLLESLTNKRPVLCKDPMSRGTRSCSFNGSIIAATNTDIKLSLSDETIVDSIKTFLCDTQYEEELVGRKRNALIRGIKSEKFGFLLVSEIMKFVCNHANNPKPTQTRYMKDCEQ